MSCDYCRLEPGQFVRLIPPDLSCRDCGRELPIKELYVKYLFYNPATNNHTFELFNIDMCPACKTKGKYLFAECKDGGLRIELPLMLPIMEEVE